MKIALKKGVRGAISQKAALGILIYIHQIHLFIIPVHEEMSKFTEMKVTLEMNSGGREERTRWKVAPKKELFWETEKTQVAPVTRDSFLLIGNKGSMKGPSTMAGN